MPNDVGGLLREVLEREGAVRLAYLFGSVARGESHRHSDVDVAVRLDRRLDAATAAGLTRRLEAAVGHPVDLIDLESASPLLLHEIVAEGQPIVVRDPSEQADFELRAIARYLDTAHLRRVQHDYLKQRVEERRARQD